MYKGVECQSLESEEDYKEPTEEEKNQKILQKRLEKYALICKTQAPYPLCYLGVAKGNEGFAIIIGMLIDEGILK